MVYRAFSSDNANFRNWRNAADRFELFVFEGADSHAELASIGWRCPLASLLD